MNSPVSGLSPTPVAPAPPALKRAPTPRRRRFPWVIAILVLLIGGTVAVWRVRSNAAEKSELATQAAIRTATVRGGSIQKTIRLTGVTSAERYVSLVTPVMRANRSGRGREGGAAQAASIAGGGSVGALSTGRGGGGGRGSSDSSSSQSSDTAQNVASSAGAVAGSSNTSASSSASSAGGGYSAPTSSSAFQAATSRIGGSSAKSSSAAPSRATGASTSEALGSDGLGSTSSQLNQGTPGAGGGAGGGGGNDFMLILQELIKPGSRVKKGEVIAEFDRQFMLLRLDDYRSSVAQQQANLKKLKAELEVYRDSHRQTIATAKATLEKAKLDLKTTPVLSAIDAERMKLALDEADAQYKQLLSEVKYVEISEKAQVRNAELDLKASELELRRAEQNADRMVSRATIDGMTVMQNMMRGSDFSQIQQGDQLYPGQFFMQVVDTSSMVINATLNQVDSERLRLGAKASVRFDAYPDLELPAHVVAIAAVTKTGGFRASFVKEIPVRLKLDKMDPRVIPDLSVSADVLLQSEDAPAIIPLDSVFREGPEGRTYVYVKEDDAWRRRDIELGLMNFTSVSVRTGLKPGEILALEKPPNKSGA